MGASGRRYKVFKLPVGRVTGTVYGDDVNYTDRCDLQIIDTVGGFDRVCSLVDYQITKGSENLYQSGGVGLRGVGSNFIGADNGDETLLGMGDNDTLFLATGVFNYGTTNNLAPGKAVLAENATGFHVADRIVGNGLANRLDGGWRSDTMNGGCVCRYRRGRQHCGRWD